MNEQELMDRENPFGYQLFAITDEAESLAKVAGKVPDHSLFHFIFNQYVYMWHLDNHNEASEMMDRLKGTAELSQMGWASCAKGDKVGYETILKEEMDQFLDEWNNYREELYPEDENDSGWEHYNQKIGE